MDRAAGKPSNRRSNTPAPSPRRPPLSIIRALIQVFSAVFRSAALTLLQFVSILMGALGAAAVVGFFVLGGAGFLGLRFARRNKSGD